jgi:hypothetical protein
MSAVKRYFDDLTHQAGIGWNRFWFTPMDATIGSGLRILTGLMALWFLLSFTPDLTVWFGPRGLLPLELIGQLTGADQGQWNGRASVLYFVDEPGLLFATHVAAVAIVAAFTAGFASRITNVLSLLVVLSYVHRAPMITGQFEPILTLMLFYLCLIPTGQAWSVDSWLARRKQIATGESPRKTDSQPSMAAGIAMALMKVHVSALYVMMALTKLGGSDTWWAGEAMWWLAAHSESRLIDLTFLHSWEYLINFWTHAVVGFELIFGLLIWNRLARPLLLGIAVIHWILIALVTGLLSFGAIMLIANLAFVPAESWSRMRVSRS